MPKLPKRLPYEMIVISALALSSCTPDWKDAVDVADVNARNAIYRVNQLESRVSEIESKLNM